MSLRSAKESANLVSKKMLIGAFHRYQMKCKSVSKKSPRYNPMSIVWVFAVMALAVVLSFILTLLLGFEDIPVEEAAAEARKHQSAQPTVAKEVSLN